MKPFIHFIMICLLPLSAFASEAQRCFDLFIIGPAPLLSVKVSGLGDPLVSFSGENYVRLLDSWGAEVQSLMPSAEYPSELNVRVQNELIGDSQAVPGKIVMHNFEVPKQPVSRISSAFLFHGKAVYMHEYTHVLLMRNFGRWSSRLKSISDTWREIEILNRLFDELNIREQQQRAKLGSLITGNSTERHNLIKLSTEAYNRAQEAIHVSQPYQEVLADLVAVLATRNLSAMENAIRELPKKATSATVTLFYRDFAQNYNLKTWEYVTETHIQFSPVRTYLGTVIEKYGWEKAEFIFNAVLKASIHRMEMELAIPAERTYNMSVRNEIYIQAIEDALNGRLYMFDLDLL